MADPVEPRPIYFIEGLFLIVLLIVGILFTRPLFVRNLRPTMRIEGMLEAEDLKVRDKSPKLEFQKQPTRDFGSGKWTQDFQLFGVSYNKDDFAEFELPVTSPGKYRLNAYLTRSYDYGIVQFSLDEKKLGGAIDLLSPEGTIVDTGKIILGERELTEGTHLLRIQVIDKNPKNLTKQYFFGIDGFVLEKI